MQPDAQRGVVLVQDGEHVLVPWPEGQRPPEGLDRVGCPALPHEDVRAIDLDGAIVRVEGQRLVVERQRALEVLLEEAGVAQEERRDVARGRLLGRLGVVLLCLDVVLRPEVLLGPGQRVQPCVTGRRHQRPLALGAHLHLELALGRHHLGIELVEDGPGLDPGLGELADVVGHRRGLHGGHDLGDGLEGRALLGAQRKACKHHQGQE